MTIQQIYYAIVISEAGSINKAAERLYVSQPSLTASIQELEKSLGITIFNRSGRGMTLTNDGKEFMIRARQVYSQYDELQKYYSDPEQLKIKFSVSTQHYSFAVKAFAQLVKKYGTSEYEFTIKEEKTRDVIGDVATAKSEIGLLYLSDFNRKVIEKQLRSNNLAFHPLVEAKAYVYLYKNHPLAKRKSIRFESLSHYPCLQFDQGDDASAYYAEEILSENEYPHIIHTNDRATNLNLMKALNAYTLCSGIICEELNGDDFVAVPFKSDKNNKNSVMEIGYITLKNSLLSEAGKRYIEELQNYLSSVHAGI